MQIIKNTLKLVIERFDDPGLYPSGAGGYPLPSHDYVEQIDGEVVIELEPDDIELLVDDLDPDIPGLHVTKWYINKIQGGRFTLTVQEFDAALPERPEPLEWEYDWDTIKELEFQSVQEPLRIEGEN